MTVRRTVFPVDARFCFDCECALRDIDDALCMACIRHRLECTEPVASIDGPVTLYCHGAGANGMQYARLYMAPYPLTLTDVQASTRLHVVTWERTAV